MLKSIDKNNTSNDEDGILIEEQEAEGFKCGYCGEILRVQVFLKDDKVNRKIYCPKCEYSVRTFKRPRL